MKNKLDYSRFADDDSEFDGEIFQKLNRRSANKQLQTDKKKEDADRQARRERAEVKRTVL